MTQANYIEFCDRHRAEGYTEFVEKAWAPDLQLELHQHPFDVQARVVSGEMWLTHSQQEWHLSAGDDFALKANVSHTERYGAQGALVWIARRHH
ncbi:MAG: hypothetical protein RL357_1196 [Pseudomonadota bacterium]